jgi:hypothetical protein
MDETPGHAPALPSQYLAPLGLALVAAVSLFPLCVGARPIRWYAPYSSENVGWAMKGLVVFLLLVPIAVREGFDRETEPQAVSLTSLFLLLSGLMTACHGWLVDWHNEAWQRQLYLDIFNHGTDQNGLRIPHQYRPLPYGFVRTLEWVTGDWWFACIAYRWYFTFWFVWGAHQFARLFLRPKWALATLVPLVALYPLSIAYYRGQLTDPLSHALFVLSLIYIIQDRWVVLTASLVLGVLAKETAVLLAASYFACYWRNFWPSLLRTAVMGATCAAAYFTVWLRAQREGGFEWINGTGLMIGTNLGIGAPIASTFVPLYENYLQPLFFVGLFLPVIIWRWRTIDGRLWAICLTLVPLLLLSNLCFGWMYESRNYMPLVPLLATMAGVGFQRRQVVSASAAVAGGP